nr:V-type proton ATPase 116 kDa subunit [Seculamonas ecuadoriensis]
MGSMWRSAPMELVQLIVQRDAAFETAEALGRAALVQFRDLNVNQNAFARTYAEEVKSVEELERKLRYFEKVLHQEKKKLKDGPVLNESLEDLEAKFARLERDLRRESMTDDALQREMNQMREELHVLSQDSSFFDVPASSINASGSMRYQDVSDESAFKSRVGYLTGLIASDKFEQFQSLLYRATRGKLYLQEREIPDPLIDPSTGEKVRKRVFMILVAGSMTQGKAKKICESFGASVYPYPESRAEVSARRDEINADLKNKETVLGITKSRKFQILDEIRPQLHNWRMKLARDKAVYHTLNMWRFVTGSPRVTAEAWVPSARMDDVRKALIAGERAAASDVPTVLRVITPTPGDTTPTFIPQNKFTEGFQKIVDSYGIPRHGEVNPGVFTITFFPFLFAVMFGDWGHAILMLCFSLFLIIREKAIEASNIGEIFGMLFRGRYVLLLMSLYSIVTGLLYNDIFALSFDIFGSAYTMPPDDPTAIWLPNNGVYPFGVDPVWFGRENKLMFYNSMKMKMAVILGVAHMMCGIFVSAFNHIHNSDMISLLFEFIPEVLFLGCTFGYMCIMIFVKWSINWWEPRAVVDPENPQLQSPPSLLTMMTNFFLSAMSGGVPVNPATGKRDDLIYPGQPLVQGILVAVAFLSVPVLLLPKPFILRARAAAAKKRSFAPSRSSRSGEEAEASRSLIASSHEELDIDHEGGVVHGGLRDTSGASSSGGEASHSGGHGGHGHGGEFDFGDCFVHQMIHTIEFVLGAISNTASYLRLWALSLAHSQLSEVFWDFVFSYAVTHDKFYGVFTMIGFAIWAMLTLGVLLMMESLSAFLHALRLTWVEFQNKFYLGDGVKFIPFSLRQVEKDAEDLAATGAVSDND